MVKGLGKKLAAQFVTKNKITKHAFETKLKMYPMHNLCSVLNHTFSENNRRNLESKGNYETFWICRFFWNSHGLYAIRGWYFQEIVVANFWALPIKYLDKTAQKIKRRT